MVAYRRWWRARRHVWSGGWRKPAVGVDFWCGRFTWDDDAVRRWAAGGGWYAERAGVWGDGGSVGVRARGVCGFWCRWCGSTCESAFVGAGVARRSWSGSGWNAPSMPAGLAASGAHTPLAPVAATATPPGAAPATGGMMLPPPGMGGPAAPAMAGGGAAATIPATAPASSGGNSAGSGSAVNPNAGATLVPASVVTPAAGAAQRVRPLSPDVLAAAALAWSLARSGDVRAYPLDWAVVFPVALGVGDSGDERRRLRLRPRRRVSAPISTPDGLRPAGRQGVS